MKANVITFAVYQMPKHSVQAVSACWPPTLCALPHSSLSYYSDGLWVSGGATIGKTILGSPLPLFVPYLPIKVTQVMKYS